MQASPKFTLYSDPRLILHLITQKHFVFLVGPPAQFLQIKINEGAVYIYAHRPQWHEIMAKEIIIKTTHDREYVLRLRSISLRDKDTEIPVPEEQWPHIIEHVYSIQIVDEK